MYRVLPFVFLAFACKPDEVIDVDQDGIAADVDCDDANPDVSYAIDLYTDADGDGYGAGALLAHACPAAGQAPNGEDCDDANAEVFPGATDAWYDGVDADCAGDDDDDADHDGDKARGHGGGDCDDADPDLYTDHGCRPETTAVNPSAATLTLAGPFGGCDLTFDAEGSAWVASIEIGLDHVYKIMSGGSMTPIGGLYDQDENAIAVDPVTGDVAVAQGDGVETSIGLSQAFGTVVKIADGVTDTTSSLYVAPYVGAAPTSIAWASDGCIYVPHFEGGDSVSCVETDGTVTTVVSGLPGWPEAVALDPDEALYVSLGAEIRRVDGATTTLVATAGAPVLDFVVDYDGTFYVETTAGNIEHVDGAATPIATVVGQGKLAISPSGWLVRLRPSPAATPTWEEWAL